jgi:hypothetical protein
LHLPFPTTHKLALSLHHAAVAAAAAATAGAAARLLLNRLPLHLV